MTNEQMTANRFANWARARKVVAAIKAHLAEGRTVQISTYTAAARLNRKHIDMVKATKTGVYMQRGSSWQCIDGCNISVFA